MFIIVITNRRTIFYSTSFMIVIFSLFIFSIKFDYIILISQFKQMSENYKRSLRERRAPKSFDSDNEDIDPYGYGRPPYNKDVRTPSQLLNSDAKLFVKFINNTNKKFREYELDQRRKKTQSIKETKPAREKRGYPPESSLELQRKALLGAGTVKSDASKKSKDHYNYKTSANNSDNQVLKKNEAFLDKIKTLTMESATKMRFLEISLGQNKLESEQIQPEQTLRNARSEKKSIEASNEKPVGQSQNGKRQLTQQPINTNGGFFPMDEEKIKQMNELQQNLGLPKTDFDKSNKIFKRSGYHVAICYSIYLKKLGEKGPIVDEEIDPTIHARKLKEEISRNS